VLRIGSAKNLVQLRVNSATEESRPAQDRLGKESLS